MLEAATEAGRAEPPANQRWGNIMTGRYPKILYTEEGMREAHER